jgi:hypothetical protein
MSNDDLQFRGGGLNPLNWVDRYAQYRYKDPDAPSARDVHDPHTWEDPDPSLRERLKPATIAGWLAAGMVTFVLGGLALYLIPIFAPTFHNPLFLGMIIFATYSAGLVLWGRKRGVEAYRSLVKSIIYYGDDIDARVGEDAGTDGRSTLFTPYTHLGFAGLSTRELKKRDLPYDASKLRSNPGDTGDEPVVDRLNQTTRTIDTETLGRIHVTWTDDMEYDTFGRESDRYLSRPRRIDEDVVRDMNEMIESLETAITTLRQQKSMLEQRAGELRDTRTEALIPELEQTLTLMQQMYEIQPDDQQRKQPAVHQNEGGKRGTGVTQELWDEVENELEDDR